MRSLAFALFFLVSSACDDSYPRDPEQTSERVARSGVLRVGITEHPPWTVRSERGDARGPEAEVVRRFAQAIGATAHFRWGQQEALLEALEHFELDLVVGGLREDTLFADKVGLSDPWYVERWGVGLPAQAEPVSDLDGLEVLVAPESLLASKLRKAGARPQETPAWRTVTGALAAPLPVLRARGATLVDDELAVHEHVIAAPPGENRWLGQLARFLARDAVTLAALGASAWQ